VSTATAGTSHVSTPAAGLPVGWWRLCAAGAAVALVVAGRGDLSLLAVAVAIAAGTPWGAVTGVVALTSVAVRWGSTDLEALGGAVGVLGPAVRVGPTGAGVSCLLAGVALMLGAFALPHERRSGRVALGAAAALAVVGPVALSDGGLAALAAASLVGLITLGLVAGARVRVPPTVQPAALVVAVVALALAAPW
jgi:hypothetical protein